MVDDNHGSEWIVHREHGVGRVLNRDGRRVGAKFDDRYVEVERAYRPVAADSLEVRLALDRRATLESLATDPLGVLKVLLRDRGQPATAAELTRAVVAAGSTQADAERWWTAVVAGLADDPSVMVTGDPPAYALAAADPASAAALPSPAPQDRAAAKPDAEAVAVLIERIGSMDDASRLCDLVFDHTSTDVAKAAALRFGEVSTEGRRSDLLVARMERALASPERSASEEDRWSSMAGTLRRLRLLALHGLSPPVLRVLVRCDELLAGATADAAPKARTELTQILRTGKPTADAFEQAATPLPDEVLVGRFTRLPIGPDAPRVAYLDGLARAGRRSVLLDRDTWRGLDAPSLASVMDRPSVELTLSDEGGRLMMADLVRKVLSPLKAEGLAVLAGTPALIGLFDDRALEGALEGLARADRNVGRLRALFASGLVAEAESSAQRLVDEARASVEEAQIRAAHEAQRAHEAVSDAERRADHAERLLRTAASEASVPHESELRQVRIDERRRAAAILSELSRSLGPAQTERLVEVAVAHGLQPIGTIGETTAFDPTAHTMLSGEGSGQVTVLELGWRTTVDDQTLLLDRALVKQAD